MLTAGSGSQSESASQVVAKREAAREGLFHACRSSDVEALAEYNMDGIDLDLVDPFFGISGLWCAAQAGHPEPIKFLLERLASVTTTDSETKSRPLHMAALSGNAEATQLLLSAAPLSDSAILNGAGQTALFLACQAGTDLDTVRVLAKAAQKARKADKSAPSIFEIRDRKTNFTPMEVAANKTDYEVCNILVSFGADPEVSPHIWQGLQAHTRLLPFQKQRILARAEKVNTTQPPITAPEGAEVEGEAPPPEDKKDAKKGKKGKKGKK
jgi:hypothetical protein